MTQELFLAGSVHRENECTKYIRIIEKYVHPGKVLDIGCGMGTFMWFAKARGWETEGIELNPHRAGIAQSMQMGTIHRHPVEHCSLLPGSFDAIVMIDVFSHLRAPKSTLSHVVNLLKPDGILLIRTGEIIKKPDLCDLPSSGWGVPHHLFWNSGNTLEQYADGIHATLIYKESTPYQEYFLRNMFFYKSKNPVKNIIKAIARNTPFMIELIIRFKSLTYRHNPIRDTIAVFRNSQQGNR
jgi:SAM-dependent methyltransferase